MRVLHVNQTMAQRGGVERYLARLVPEQVREGAEVRIFTGGGTPPGLSDSIGAPIDEVPGAGSLATARPEHADRMLRLVRSFRPDIVHVHGWSDAVTLDVLLRTSRVVRTFHDHQSTCAGGARYLPALGKTCERAHGPACLVSAYATQCNLQAPRAVARSYVSVTRAQAQYPRYARIITASHMVRDTLVRHGADAEWIDVIPYFPLVEPAPERTPEENSLLFAGRVIREKGLDTAIRALPLLPSARLLVAGEGPAVLPNQRLAARLGVGERVEWLGWKEPDELAPLYARAAVTLFPSRWPEPFGIVGIEAMAAGRPVVGARVGGVPTWLDAPHTGLLHEAGDVAGLAQAVGTLLADPALAKRMGAAGRRRVSERFALKTHMADLRRVYELAKFAAPMAA